MHFVSLRACPVDGKRSVKSPLFVDLRVEASAFPQFGIRPGGRQWGWDLLLPPPYFAPHPPPPRLDRLSSTSQGWKRGQRREQSYELEWFQARCSRPAPSAAVPLQSAPDLPSPWALPESTPCGILLLVSSRPPDWSFKVGDFLLNDANPALLCRGHSDSPPNIYAFLFQEILKGQAIAREAPPPCSIATGCLYFF